MPTYATPDPITVTLDISVGDLQINATDRTDTTVQIRPSDPTDDSDVQAAQQTRVDYTNGTLRITGPKRTFDFSRKTRAVQVSIELPTDSTVSAQVQLGDLASTGRLGRSRFKTGAGDATLEHTGPLYLHSGAGHLSTGAIAGNAEVSTGSGKIRLGPIEGTAVVKSANGDITIDAVTGDARIRTANGEITVDHAGADVDAKTSNGTIRLGEITRGSITLATPAGDLDIGIAQGTAAWLALNTGFGHLRNQLDNTTGPEQATHTVEVRGRTSYGDITIHRS